MHFSYTTYVPLLAGVIHNARVTSGIFILFVLEPCGKVLKCAAVGFLFLLLTNFIFPQKPKKPLTHKIGEEIIFGFALHKFPDGNFARARPRGVRLSACGLKLTQRCGLQIPTQHQAVGVAPLSRKPKTPLTRGFRFPRRGREMCPA